jgi:hypothetical protein
MYWRSIIVTWHGATNWTLSWFTLLIASSVSGQLVPWSTRTQVNSYQIGQVVPRIRVRVDYNLFLFFSFFLHFKIICSVFFRLCD